MKLISLNIEGSNHLDHVIPYIQKESPDVVCLQEVNDHDVTKLKNEWHMEGLYVPTMHIDVDNEEGGSHLTIGAQYGVAIFSKLSDINFKTIYYVGSSERIPKFNRDPNSTNRVLLMAQIHHKNHTYHIITTHFTWTPNGQSTPLQHQELTQMMEKLKHIDDFVLCGDFNAPRGGDVWEKIAKKYQDNIPAHITTTLDPSLHRVKNLVRLVDGLFTTPGYHVTNVRVIDGVSDHMAIVADITAT